MKLVVMGLAGSGKTTLGRALAGTLGWRFLNANDFYGPVAAEQMAQGIGQTAGQRRPWLKRVRDALQGLEPSRA